MNDVLATPTVGDGYGHLYGISTGPGDPELITLKAARLLSECPVVAYFCKRSGAGRARTSCDAHITEGHQELPLVYPVTNEIPHGSQAYRQQIETFFEEAAEAVARELRAGRSVAVLNEGDAFFYGSFMHIYLRLKDRFESSVVPGVGAMMAGGALLPHPLMMRDDQLRVIPGTMDENDLRAGIDPQRATVIMKVGTNLPLLRHIVKDLGLEERAWYVEKASMPEERVMPLVEAPDGKAPYFSMVLIPGPGVRA
ncbi:precorrin-2 C(20)-methyltransferase [Salicola sp. Rm-C-2C1-2]|uniref:precorrin-2 C(20)-methyltransferase n=1 Tax=Salicola sp. Rm-C-2C1-2 TaxID=3141321 RepID=UPI0032E4B645